MVRSLSIAFAYFAPPHLPLVEVIEVADDDDAWPDGANGFYCDVCAGPAWSMTSRKHLTRTPISSLACSLAAWEC